MMLLIWISVFRYLLIISGILVIYSIIYFCHNSNGSSRKVELIKEGSPCVTRNKTGRCVKMRTCSTVLVDVLFPIKGKLYPEACSSDRSSGDLNPSSLICCTSCSYDYVDNVYDAVKPPSGILHYKTKSKSWNKCLDYSRHAGARCWMQGVFSKKWDPENQCDVASQTIYAAIGGMDAEKYQYTHMALLGYGPSLKEAQWKCGGTLISEKFILTAGHCISSAKLGFVTYVALGILKLKDPKEIWQRYRIKKVIPHPRYESPLKYHDIALLETERPVNFNKAVYPACLSKYEDYHYATAIGWGGINYNSRDMTDTLQFIEIKRFNDSKCKEQYPPNNLAEQGYDNKTQVCFGHETKGVDTCQGDSGGPLQYAQDNVCMYFVMGVTSYGHPCGTPGQAGIYTRVYHYIPWIESVVWPDL